MSSGNQGIYQKGLDLMFVEKAIMINIIMTENGFVDHFKLLICDKAGAFLLNHFLNYGNENLEEFITFVR